MIEEYKTLRTEIIKRQDTRIKTLQFTLAILGAIIGILTFNFKTYPSLEQQSLLIYLLFSTFALIVIDAALILTMNITQMNHVIAAYIREFIEEKANLNWETRWEKYRYRSKEDKTDVVKVGTSKALSIYYILLSVPFVIIFALQFQFSLITLAILILFLVLFGHIIYNVRKLYRLKTEVNWKDIDKYQIKK